ncbi:MAG: response regulator [bacterium]|nr:response regulator [bacterium]
MRTILIVEDSTPNAQMIKAAMETRGYNVTIAENGEEGIEVAKMLHPALILMDLRFPGRGIDGWQAIATLKADKELRNIPIIAIPVEVHHQDRERAIVAGCDYFFPKPFNIIDLLNLVGEYTGL